MGKNLDPKCKQCRRVGEKLMLKGDRCNSPKCAMVKRNYPPGIHGPKLIRRKKQSEYGIQLNEKQKAKKQYGLMEKQFRIIFDKAQRKTGKTGFNLMKLLERRLDNVIFRLGFASSRSNARQLVNHGHFNINGRKVNIPSFEVKEGDIIEIKSSSKRNKIFKDLVEKLKKHEAPGWLNLDKSELKAKVLHEPGEEDVQSNINTQMIIEHYS
ncbi:30S ribosomal protein S4 [bacterium]|nr:30S ribosomal protein S4 [bacterium]